MAMTVVAMKGIESGDATTASTIMWQHQALTAESDHMIIGPETAWRVKETLPIQALGHRWLKNIQRSRYGLSLIEAPQDP